MLILLHFFFHFGLQNIGLAIRERLTEVCGFWCANAFYSTIIAVVPVNSRLYSQYRVLSQQVCWIYIYAKSREDIGILSKSIANKTFWQRARCAWTSRVSRLKNFNNMRSCTV